MEKRSEGKQSTYGAFSDVALHPLPQASAAGCLRASVCTVEVKWACKTLVRVNLNDPPLPQQLTSPSAKYSELWTARFARSSHPWKVWRIALNQHVESFKAMNFTGRCSEVLDMSLRPWLTRASSYVTLDFNQHDLSTDWVQAWRVLSRRYGAQVK